MTKTTPEMGHPILVKLWRQCPENQRGDLGEAKMQWQAALDAGMTPREIDRGVCFFAENMAATIGGALVNWRIKSKKLTDATA
ncbi:hypothetical protein [Bradyrhizobium elkanii]|uniref:hypothetical protein n=1 Tax=Bradyrhizobium elkanii TaxID=29448 RepID=UPI00216A9F05|nr:hypothetical protein [Bradyrhizobium elkanii]MCS3689073.1 hypothetical protein [Bradyrhizobium elkanii]